MVFSMPRITGMMLIHCGYGMHVWVIRLPAKSCYSYRRDSDLSLRCWPRGYCIGGTRRIQAIRSWDEGPGCQLRTS